jgi:Ecdysteroid kinase-like family
MRPTQIAELSAGVLTSILRESGALVAAQIVDARATSFGDGKGAMSSTVRIALRYDQPEPQAPRSLIAKAAPTDPAMRAIGADLGLYRREVGFYTQLAGQVTMPTPRCYYATYAEETGAFLLLLEDIIGTHNGDRATGCDLVIARRAVAELVALHAAWWQDPQLSAMTWLQPFDPRPLQATYQRAWPTFAARMGPQLPDTLRAIGERLGGSLSTIFARYWEPPWTLVHNDFQLDNLFLSADGEQLTVIDWQSALRGQGALDVAGFLGGNLSVEDRRAGEAELLRSYHAGIVGRGVVGFSLNDLCLGYRRAIFDGFSRMVIAVASELGAEQARVHREILWPRYSTALLDLQADALLP